MQVQRAQHAKQNHSWHRCEDGCVSALSHTLQAADADLGDGERRHRRRRVWALNDRDWSALQVRVHEDVAEPANQETV